mmetsp:Transcript_7033/g.7145  ORF Transcript_7033/g.7145 Transcript_7033/m.7145 type:complete len:344 (-) Transcript_7033:261-1292(-)
MWEACSYNDMIGKMAFDKDDMLGMRFVCASSNIRSNVFGIPPMSYHDAKGIAGNIIPAIATTNAIVAGIQVLQAIKIIKGGLEVLSEGSSPLKASNGSKSSVSTTRYKDICPHTYCQRMPNRKGYYLQPTAPDPPVGACYVCNLSQLTLQIDTSVSTLYDFLKLVVKGRLGFNAPTIMQGSNTLYEEGEDADEDLAENLRLILNTCPAGGIINGSEITIEDFTQDLTVRVLVHHVSTEDLLTKRKESEGDVDSPGDLFVLDGKEEFDNKQAVEAAAGSVPGVKGGITIVEGVIVTGITVVEEDEDIIMVGSTFDDANPPPIVEDVMSKKRSREEEEDGHRKKK